VKNIDIESAMRIVAERRIEQAMKEGKFDNLPGAGKPLELESPPPGENARLLWWALRILRQAGYTPDEVVLRREIEQLKERVGRETDAAKRVRLVQQLNGLVHRLNTLGTNAMNAAPPHSPAG
jgi:hypothetical protein